MQINDDSYIYSTYQIPGSSFMFIYSFSRNTCPEKIYSLVSVVTTPVHERDLFCKGQLTIIEHSLYNAGHLVDFTNDCIIGFTLRLEIQV